MAKSNTEDPVQRYLKEISHPLLEREEEIALAQELNRAMKGPGGSSSNPTCVWW